MKILQLKIFVLIVAFTTSLYASDDGLLAHQYAEMTHNNIIEIIQTQNELFEEDPDSFTRLISDAFKPIVDFDRIAKNVMGTVYWRLIQVLLWNLKMRR